MSSNKNEVEKEKTTASRKVSSFIQKNAVILIIVGAIILLAVIALGIVTSVKESQLKKSSDSLAKLEVSFNAWASQTNQSEEEGNAVLTQADEIIAKYPKQYASAKAGVIKAEVYKMQKKQQEAEDAYYAVFEKHPESHLAASCLANAAYIAEDRGDSSKALEYLLKAEEKYPESVIHQNVLFSIGRLYETSKKYDDAMSIYLKLSTEQNSSDWTKLAQTRIIFLKSQGLAK